MELRVEVCELVGKDESVGDNIEVVFAEPLLHSDHVIAHAIFASKLCALWEMINALEVSEAFEQVALAAAASP